MTSEQMNVAMAEIVQANVKAKVAQTQLPCKSLVKRIMLVLFGTAEPSIERIMLALVLAAALGIVGYYGFQNYKVDQMVERLLSEATPEHDQQVVTLYVYKQHCKTDVPVFVNKVVDKYIRARGLNDLINQKRQEVYSNAFSLGLMTMIGCPIVQGLANSLDH